MEEFKEFKEFEFPASTKDPFEAINKNNPPVGGAAVESDVEQQKPTKKANKKSQKKTSAGAAGAADGTYFNSYPIFNYPYAGAPVGMMAAPPGIIAGGMKAAPPVSKKVNKLPTSAELIAKINEDFQILHTLYASLSSYYAKFLNEFNRVNSKAEKRKSTKNPPSAFVTSIPISDELATFLNVPLDTKMSRNDVSSQIHTYIKTNKLQNTKNGRIIEADSKLKELLNIPAEVELNYFNLQTYLKVHFRKPNTTVATNAKA